MTSSPANNTAALYANIRDDQEEDAFTPKEEQEQVLKEVKKQVETEAHYMKRALDKNQLEEALKHSAKMLSELRTSALTPKNYYEVYMRVFDHMRHLEMFFLDEKSRGRKIQELYEVVQHAGNIVPRLYLLITVGSVYIRSKEKPAKEILKDLVDMCKGVQHPTRGLFLRHYMTQSCKDKLPDKGSDYEGQGGNVFDAIAFVLQNFKETVNLFSRLRNTGPVKEKAKREKDRMELRILVGTNLVRLSQLDGVDEKIYKENVLPSVLDVIILSNDTIAQQYLMECIIQVFPDEYHIATLTKLLESCLQLQTDVDFKTILVSLMDRLSNYAKQNPDGVKGGINIIEIFTDYIAKIAAKGIDIKDVLSIQISLMTLCLQTAPSRIDYIATILSNCSDSLGSADLSQEGTVKLVRKLLLVPLDNYKNPLVILGLEHFAQILNMLGYSDRRFIGTELARAVVKSKQQITAWQDVNKLFDLMKPLIKDEDGATLPEDTDPLEFQEEQNLIAKIAHLFHNSDTDNLFKIYSTARKHFGQGGVKRLPFTLVPLVFLYLKLAKRIHQLAKDGKAGELAVREEKVFQYVIEILDVLANQKPSVALQLYLQGAQCADSCNLDNVTFELLSQALLLYEEEDSKTQLDYLTIIINSVQSLKNFKENFETITTKLCQYSSKLLRKPDQCKAAFLCSHLFWPLESNPDMQNGTKALECLQWSLKIVKACMTAQQIPLFVDILNVYMYHFEKQNDKVVADYLNGLVELINTNISNLDEETRDQILAPIPVFYQNTLRHLQQRKKENPSYYSDVRT